MPFTSISAGWIFTLMGLLDDGRPLNQGKSHIENIPPADRLPVYQLLDGMVNKNGLPNPARPQQYNSPVHTRLKEEPGDNHPDKHGGEKPKNPDRSPCQPATRDCPGVAWLLFPFQRPAALFKISP